MKHPFWRRPLLVEISASLTVVSLSLATLSGWRGVRALHISGKDEAVYRLLLAACGVLCLSIAIAAAISRRRQKIANHPQGGQGDEVYQPGLTYLFKLQRESSEFGDHPSIPLFIELVTSMESYRRRVVETVTLDGRTVRQTTTSEFSLPDNAYQALKQSTPVTAGLKPTEESTNLTYDSSLQHPKAGSEADDDLSVRIPKATTLYVPILSPMKTELVDNFTLRGVDDKALTNLSYDETVKLSACCLRFLFIAYLNSSANGARYIDVYGGLTGEAKEAETRLLQIIAKRGAIDQSEVEDGIGDALSHVNLTRPQSDPANGFGYDEDRLIRFVSHLGVAYPIVAVIQDETPRRFRIKYERTLIPKPFIPHQNRDSSRYVKEHLRLILGLRPYQIAIPAANAFSTQSYHLLVQGPEGQYLMEQFLRCSECRKLVLPGWKYNNGAGSKECRHSDSSKIQAHYFRLRRKRGQNFAHLYMRGFASSRLKDIELLARFGETPPGTLGSSVLTSLLATLVITVIGHLLWTGPSADGTSPTLPAGVPALMLALPAVAVSWFGLKSSDDSLLRCALASRLSLMATGILSMWVAVLYLSNATPHAAEVPYIGIFGVPVGSLWGVIILSSFLNSLYVGATFIVRSSYYLKLLARPDNDNIGEQKMIQREGNP